MLQLNEDNFNGVNGYPGRISWLYDHRDCFSQSFVLINEDTCIIQGSGVAIELLKTGEWFLEDTSGG